MGVDIYGCYGPSRVVPVRLDDGDVVEAVLCRWITRPWSHWDKGLVEMSRFTYVPRMTAMKIARIHKLWEGQERPRHMLHVFDSQHLKENGLKNPVEGSLTYSTQKTPLVWLEEYSGVLPMGECKRQGRLWVFQGWGTGYSVQDNGEWARKIQMQYREARIKIECPTPPLTKAVGVV